jgi:hypothetical protein
VSEENLKIVDDLQDTTRSVVSPGDTIGIGGNGGIENIKYSTIAANVVQNTETIGILVCSNLLYTPSVSSSTSFHIYSKSPSSLTFGSFPTTQGVIDIQTNGNVINDGDVVIVESQYSRVAGVGHFMVFKWLENNKKKVPSMAQSPDAKYSLWQIVQLDANGNMVNKDKDTTNTAYPIAFDSYVGFYAFNCNPNDPTPVTCGWMSAKTCGGNCYPYMNGNNGGPCEAWKVVNKTGGSESYVLDNFYLGVQSSPNNNCGYPGWWLTNANREFTNPPTLYKPDSFDAFDSYWRFNRVLKQEPLPK